MTGLLPKDREWVKSQVLIENFYKKNKDFKLQNKFSVVNAKDFTESLESKVISGLAGAQMDVNEYKIVHASGWTYTYHFLRIRGILDVPVVFVAEVNNERKDFWFYQKQMELYTNFNRLFYATTKK